MDAETSVALVAAVSALAGGGAVASVGAARARRRDANVVSSPPGVRLTDTQLPDGLADMLAALSASTVLLDSSDRIVLASATAYAFGLVRGTSLASSQLVALVRQVRRDSQVREERLELGSTGHGPRLRPVKIRVAPLADGLVLVLGEDQTESRRVDEVRRDFVANVSHELKTPVGALILLADAVGGASDEPEAVRRFAARMQHEAQRLSDLVQELIDLSRLQGDDPLREAALVSVDDVVVDAMDRCRLAAAAKDIELVTGGVEGLGVLGDESQLVTAVRNLIDNAISYSPEQTRVAVSTHVVDHGVEVAVTDQGIGIPKADLGRVFERFYRVDPARSRATGGTGLGLSIVKHVAENHGGEVTVWSVEGSGSTFTVRLPIGAPAAADPPADVLVAPAPQEAP